MDDQTQHAANGSNESGPPRIEWGIVLAHGVLTVVLCRMSGQNLANEVAVRGVQVLTFPLGWIDGLNVPIGFENEQQTLVIVPFRFGQCDVVVFAIVVVNPKPLNDVVYSGIVGLDVKDSVVERKSCCFAIQETTNLYGNAITRRSVNGFGWRLWRFDRSILAT